MAAPPPIIRSSKAFSVEIPEGSKSAKSRRSDIVPNDELEIHRKSSQFHEAGSDALKSPDFHTDDGFDARSVSVASTDHADKIHNETQADTDEDRHAGEDSHVLSENLQGIDQSQTSDILIQVPDSEQNAANLQTVDEDAHRDRHAQVDSGHALQDRFGAETHAPLKDRAMSIQAQGLLSNVQGIEQDALRDHLQSLPGDEAKNNQILGIEKDALKDNRQGLADEALNQANQVLELSQDPEKNMQGIAQDALRNNQQSIDNEALRDNQQALSDESIQGRKDNQAKAHVQDHVVALPNTHQVLKPGPSPLAVNPRSGQRPGVADHAPTPPHLETDSQHAALSKSEKAKRIEEFHGRVEAIRKSVSGINNLLDDLQDKH